MRKTAWFFNLFLAVTLAMIIPRFAPGRGELDFIKYWSASRLFIQRQNPFDSQAQLELQLETRPDLGLKEGDIYETWNPPWLLLLISPLAALPFDLAVPLWVVLNVLLITLSMICSWKLAGGSTQTVEFLYVLAAAFLAGSVITIIRIGQVSALVLLSITAGLWLLRKQKEFLAGVLFFFTSIKPHLVFLIVATLFIWAIRSRKWRFFLGMATVGALSLLAAWIIYPGWLQAYLSRMENMPYQAIYTSTFGSLFELLFGWNFIKYIGILLLLLTIPLAKLFKQDDLGASNLALAVTLPFAPYGFNFDQILLLPAIAQIIFWVTHHQLSHQNSRAVIIGFALIYLLQFWLMTIKELPYSWFFIVSFLLMLLYLFSWRVKRVSVKTA